MEKKKTVKVSVIIPVYNTMSYLCQCLDSVVNQTLEEIEIICVDDASTDGSADILKKYECRFANVTCIWHLENRSLAQARKSGVVIAKGEYVMFLDSDDFLETDACERAYYAITEAGTDILQFGVRVENCSDLSENRILSIQKNMNMRPDKSIKEDLLTTCFLSKGLAWNLITKIYSTELCKNAYQKIEDRYINNAEDLYATFFLLEGAETYASIEDLLYHYCFGRGVNGHRRFDLTEFCCCCKEEARVFRAIKHYIVTEELKPKLNYQGVLQAIGRRLRQIESRKWFNNLREEDKAAALVFMHEIWGNDSVDTVDALHSSLRKQRAELATYLNRNSEKLRFKDCPRNIRTVVFYNPKITNGGAMRVVTMLANRLAEYKMNGEYPYCVILVTCEEPNRNEYSLSPNVIRRMIPSFEMCKEALSPRVKALTELLEEFPVDAFINADWSEANGLWDYLCIKLHPSHPRFLIHVHNFCGMVWKSRRNLVQEFLDFYALADGLVVLSEADRSYWSLVNPNTRYIPNPCYVSKAVKNERSSGSGNILWLARVSQVKRPLDMLLIMEIVIRKFPDARCRMVGARDDKLFEKLRMYIAEHGLENNVTLEGFHKDVTPFYKNSDVFVLTSESEGFPLTLYESAAYGIPTVSYALPWLTYYDDLDGWDRVPQGDVEAAARRIIWILENREAWEMHSAALYQSFQQFYAHDVLEDWLDFFHQYEYGSIPSVNALDPDTARIILCNIAHFHTDGYQIMLKENKRLRKKITEIETRLTEESKEKTELVKTLREEKKLNEQLIIEIKGEKEKNDQSVRKLQKARRKNAELMIQLKKEKKKREDIIESTSYRLGRMLTWLPRKLH